MMSTSQVLLMKKEGVATLTLNRPERMNAITPQLVGELLMAFQDVEQDAEVRVVVLTGAGRGFCAGADMNAEYFSEKSSIRRRELIKDCQRVPLVIRRLSKPVIAAVNGAAVGAGCDFALSCDIRIASEDAIFGEVFSQLGLVPDNGATYLLPRLVGVAKACELIFTGDRINAQEAFRIGMINRVFPASRFEEEVIRFAKQLAQGSPLAMALSKKAIYQGLHMDFESTLNLEASLQPLLQDTEDCKEGLAAFREKRKPIFKGK